MYAIRSYYGNARVIASRFMHPLLTGLAAQATTPAIEIALGIPLGEIDPGVDALLLDPAVNQPVTELDSGLLPMLFVAGADLGTLVIGHQRQTDAGREGALLELNRRPGIDQRNIVEENVEEFP